MFVPFFDHRDNTQTEEELAVDYAKVLHNLHGEEISRFASMIMVGYSPPSLINTRSWESPMDTRRAAYVGKENKHSDTS